MRNFIRLIVVWAVWVTLAVGCDNKVVSTGKLGADSGHIGDGSVATGGAPGGGSGGSAGAGGAAGSPAGSGGAAGQPGGSGGSGGTAGSPGGSGGVGGGAAGSPAGTGGGGGSGGSGGQGGSGGGGQLDAGAPDSGGPGCDKNSCESSGFSCCGKQCVNLDNDIFNCGKCGNRCQGTNPYCGGGACSAPPCNGGACSTGFCCGVQCCAAGQLCCQVPGPVQSAYPSCSDPSDTGTCPRGCKMCVCASPDTPIAAPEGDRPIALIRTGDLVYSLNRGRIEAVPVLRTSRVAVSNHRVIRVALSSGTVLEISAGHPLADGRSFGELRPGDAISGVEVLSVTVVDYRYPFTYDILPDSDTGTYLAGGALIGSTLAVEPGL